MDVMRQREERTPHRLGAQAPRVTEEETEKKKDGEVEERAQRGQREGEQRRDKRINDWRGKGRRGGREEEEEKKA